jgi:hypothetical protein
VWGNHDFSLRGDIPERTRARFPEIALTLMAHMQPRLVIGECHFSHKESSVDPFDVEQLWDANDRPLDLAERASLGFRSAPARLQLVGHYHRWWATTPSAHVPWEGSEPLAFDPSERYFVVVSAVYKGWCGILDLELALLEPLWCGDGEPERGT